jgi:hypothetical protein
MTGVAWIIALIWFAIEPGFEPLLAVLGGVSTLLATRIVPDTPQNLPSTDLLFKLEEKFNSDSLRRARAEAAPVAISILEGQSVKKQDIQQAQVRMDEILNFFDMLALMVKQGKLDKKYAHFQFAYWLKHYYAYQHNYIRLIQKKRPQQWEHIPWIYGEFLEMEPQPEPEDSDYLLPKEKLKNFFDSESKIVL